MLPRLDRKTLATKLALHPKKGRTILFFARTLIFALSEQVEDQDVVYENVEPQGLPSQSLESPIDEAEDTNQTNRILYW